MSDLIDDPREGENAPEFSVTELSGAIKRMIEGEFSHVRIKGEIGRVSFPRSGHVYLDLKDDRSVIAGVMWKGDTGGGAARPGVGVVGFVAAIMKNSRLPADFMVKNFRNRPGIATVKKASGQVQCKAGVRCMMSCWV